MSAVISGELVRVLGGGILRMQVHCLHSMPVLLGSWQRWPAAPAPLSWPPRLGAYDHLPHSSCQAAAPALPPQPQAAPTCQPSQASQSSPVTDSCLEGGSTSAMGRSAGPNSAPRSVLGCSARLGALARAPQEGMEKRAVPPSCWPPAGAAAGSGRYAWAATGSGWRGE